MRSGRKRDPVSREVLRALARLKNEAARGKYLRRHPVPRVTIAGGVAKMTKLAQGLLDLHSQRGSVDRVFLLTEESALRLKLTHYPCPILTRHSGPDVIYYFVANQP